MTRAELVTRIFKKRSYLCVGLDTDISRIPPHILTEPDPVFAFNRAIIDATRDYCVSYKINTAFYEAQGAKGWATMEKTADYIGEEYFRIADAKRGDIGNTSEQYAKAFFQIMPFDAVTIAPYMGEDSVKPFLQFAGKWGIVLGLTSNRGANDFEMTELAGKDTGQGVHYLYQEVLKKVSGWGSPENLMFVIGATRPDEFQKIRKRVPAHFFLVPGVGAQGGSLKEISQKAMIADCGILVNSSRDILYQSAGTDFAEAAGRAAKRYRDEMALYLP